MINKNLISLIVIIGILMLSYGTYKISTMADMFQKQVPKFVSLPNETIIQQLSPVYQKCYFENGIIYCCAPPMVGNKTLENKTVWICDSFRVLQNDRDIIILRNPV